MYPEIGTGYKHVQLLRPCTSNSGKTSDIICLKNVNRAWVIVEFTQAVGHATTITPTQCTDVSNSLSDNKVLTNTIRGWINEDTAASDTLVAETAAKNFSVAATVKYKTLVMEITPHALDVANGFDCVYFTVADSSQASNFVSITALLETKYAQATPPAAITD